MPKIEFKLKDPKYCNGCPVEKYDCDMGAKKYYCKFLSNQYKIFHLDVIYLDNNDTKIKRPQACIDKYGE